MTDADRVIATAVAAHGGREFWQGLQSVEAVLSADGFLFKTKHVPPLRHMRVEAAAHRPYFVFHDYPRAGWRGEWLGEQEVRIVSSDGTVMDRRASPRSAFRGLRRELWWDELDFLFFAGYATWNYLTMPFLFLQPGFRFEVLPGADGEAVHLAVTFPEDVPTHSRRQVFHFAPSGEMLRFDYTAEVVGNWAHAAHLCSEYREFSGLRMPTRRRVRPLFGLRNPLPFPTIVAIDVHELAPMR
jgi:hypothetical protein